MEDTKTVKLFIYYRLPIIIYCILIFFMSSRPAPETIPALPHMDKLLHLIAYTVCGALFLRAFSTFPIKNNFKLVIISILASGLYGLSDEVHQYFVSSRSADIMDFFVDVIGSICGVLLYQSVIVKIRSN